MYLTGIADEAGKSIEAQIKAHKKLGWGHIELRNVDGVNITKITDAHFEAVYAKLAEARMQVSCLGSEIANWATKISGDFAADVDDLKRAIPRMRKLNVRFIRIMSYPNDGWAEDAWHSEVLKRLRELTKIAEEGNVILAHENCSGWGGLSHRNCSQLVEEIDSPSFKILFDTGNPPAEGQDSMEFYNAVRNHIAHIHIKDAKKENGKTVFTFPGEGDGYVQEILVNLKNTCYDGGISIEPHLSAVIHENKGISDEEESARVYIDYGRRLEEMMKWG